MAKVGGHDGQKVPKPKGLVPNPKPQPMNGPMIPLCLEFPGTKPWSPWSQACFSQGEGIKPLIHLVDDCVKRTETWDADDSLDRNSLGKCEAEAQKYETWL